MGRKTIMLRDLAQRCVLARGAVTEQISLDEVKCGEVALTLEWRESVAALFEEPESPGGATDIRPRARPCLRFQGGSAALFNTLRYAFLPLCYAWLRYSSFCYALPHVATQFCYAWLRISSFCYAFATLLRFSSFCYAYLRSSRVSQRRAPPHRRLLSRPYRSIPAASRMGLASRGSSFTAGGGGGGEQFKRRGSVPQEYAEVLAAHRSGGAPPGPISVGGGGGGGGAQHPASAGAKQSAAARGADWFGAANADKRPPSHAAHRSSSVRELGEKVHGAGNGAGDRTPRRGMVFSPPLSPFPLASPVPGDVLPAPPLVPRCKSHHN